MRRRLLPLILIVFVVAVVSKVFEAAPPDVEVRTQAHSESTFSIRGLELGMTEEEAQHALGLPSPDLVRSGFVTFCLECDAVGEECGHTEESTGSVVISGGKVDGIFGPRLEIDHQPVLRFGAAEGKVLEVLGPPRKISPVFAGQRHLEYQFGNDSLTISLESNSLYDIYLMRPTEAGKKEIDGWVEESNLK